MPVRPRARRRRSRRTWPSAAPRSRCAATRNLSFSAVDRSCVAQVRSRIERQRLLVEVDVVAVDAGSAAATGRPARRRRPAERPSATASRRADSKSTRPARKPGVSMLAMLSAMTRWRSDRPRSAECRTPSTPFIGGRRQTGRAGARTGERSRHRRPSSAFEWAGRPPVRGGLGSSGPLLTYMHRQPDVRLETGRPCALRPSDGSRRPRRGVDGTARAAADSRCACRHRRRPPAEPLMTAPARHPRRARPRAAPQAGPRPVPGADRQGHRGRPRQPGRAGPRRRSGRGLRHRQARHRCGGGLRPAARGVRRRGARAGAAARGPRRPSRAGCCRTTWPRTSTRS